MSSQCPFGQNYDVTHAMKNKWFRNNETYNIRNFEANPLKTTFNDVEVEPKLQRIDNEGLNG